MYKSLYLQKNRKKQTDEALKKNILSIPKELKS